LYRRLAAAGAGRGRRSRAHPARQQSAAGGQRRRADAGRTGADVLMNILITSSRAPVALELIRAFGRAGHRVYATDTMCWTAVSHSRYLEQHIVTPPPRYDSTGFANVLLQIIERARIDWLIPTSAEVFFVAR